MRRGRGGAPPCTVLCLGLRGQGFRGMCFVGANDWGGCKLHADLGASVKNPWARVRHKLIAGWWGEAAPALTPRTSPQPETLSSLANIWDPPACHLQGVPGLVKMLVEIAPTAGEYYPENPTVKQRKAAGDAAAAAAAAARPASSSVKVGATVGK